MGASPAGAAQSPSDRAKAYLAANPNAPQAEVAAIANGMTPMSYANYQIGKQKYQEALPDIQKYGMQMSNLAGGGLMLKGMDQVNQVLSAPSQAAGIQARMQGRYGVTPNADQAMSMADQAALSSASTKVGLANQTRIGLTTAQQDMRFGGLGV